MKSSLPLKIVSCLVVVVLAGCGSTLPNKQVAKAKIQLTTIYSPEVGQTITAEVGQTLVSKAHLQNVPRIRIVEGVSVQTSNNGIDVAINFPQGDLDEYMADESGSYYLTGGFKRTVMGTAETDYGGVIVGKNGVANTIWWNPDRRTHTFIIPSPKEIKYEKIADRVTAHEDSFKRELVYTGISKNVVSILYREFKNDMARPAFTQDIKYDLGEGSEIGYRGARFKVISATNTGITYTLLKPLD